MFEEDLFFYNNCIIEFILLARTFECIQLISYLGIYCLFMKTACHLTTLMQPPFQCYEYFSKDFEK